MPYTAKQNRLFRAIAHGWTPPASSGIKISKADASKMASEGISEESKRKAQRRSLAGDKA